MGAIAGWLASFATGTLASILVGILNNLGWRKLVLRTLIALLRAAEIRFADNKVIAEILDGVADDLEEQLKK